MYRMLMGAIAGGVATIPMTLTMMALHRCLPRREQYPLPPRQITMKLANEADVLPQLDEQERVGVTIAAHFGAGAGLGSVYGLMERGTRSNGIALGVLAWGANYLGILPALGLLSPATKHPARRNALMIAAHGVWGLTAVAVFEMLKPRKTS